MKNLDKELASNIKRVEKFVAGLRKPDQKANEPGADRAREIARLKKKASRLEEAKADAVADFDRQIGSVKKLVGELERHAEQEEASVTAKAGQGKKRAKGRKKATRKQSATSKKKG